MRPFLPALVLGLGLLSYSPSAQAQSSSELVVTAGVAPVYTQLTDTIKPAAYLSKDSKVQVINIDNSRWALVGRGGKRYYIARANIGAAPTPAGSSSEPLLSPSDIAAIPREPGSALIHYAAVEAVAGASKDELYGRAKAWAIGAYKSPKDVIQAEDKDAGIIMCKGFADVPVRIIFSTTERLYFTVKISVKEGRYRYELQDFFFKGYPTSAEPHPEDVPAERYVNNAYYPSNGKANKVALSFTQALVKEATTMEASIKRAMSKGDDW